MNQVAHFEQETQVEVAIRQNAQQLIATAAKVMVLSREDLSEATDILKEIKNRIKTAEEERKDLVSPFNDGVKRINSRFKAMLEPLAEAGEKLASKMLQFQQSEERKAREEAARLEKIRLEEEKKKREEAEAARKAEEAAILENSGGEQLDRAAPPPAAPEPPPSQPITVQSLHKPTTYGQTGAVSTVKKIWAFELVDLSQVPVEFCVLDQVKVNQAIRAGAREIPGLRIFQKDSLSVR